MGQKFVQHGFLRLGNIPIFKNSLENTWCSIAIQNATYWRKTGFDIYKRKKIPIPITNKISSSRISDELRVLKVMPCEETKSDPLLNFWKKLAKNKKLFKFALKIHFSSYYSRLHTSSRKSRIRFWEPDPSLILILGIYIQKYKYISIL